MNNTIKVNEVQGFIKQEGYLKLKGGSKGPSAENVKKFRNGELGACPVMIENRDGSFAKVWIQHGSARHSVEYHQAAYEADFLISCYPTFIEDESLRSKAFFKDHPLRLGLRVSGDYLYIKTMDEGNVLKKDYNKVISQVKKQQLV